MYGLFEWFDPHIYLHRRAHPRTHARSERDKARERLKIVSEKFKFAKANAFIFSLQPSS